MSTPPLAPAPLKAAPQPLTSLTSLRAYVPLDKMAAWGPAVMKSLVPLTIVAVALTALLMMVLWQDQSSYRPVFGEREKISAADMMSVLDAEHIAYRLHPESGQVLVPADQLGKVRMLLAAKGVVARLPEGLELMDREDPLGVSQFVQDVRFKRGLEGELVQSILALDAVASARVHLSIGKSSSFVVNDAEKSSASVVVALKPGRSLGPEQIAAIVNMVAGSVAHLNPRDVSLIDQAGNFLSARIDAGAGLEGIQGSPHDMARRYQDDTLRNVNDLLSPVVGAANYRASVTAEVDNDQIEETRESYGDKPHVTNEAMRDERDADAVALGVPGSLSNRPVAVSAASSPTGSAARKNATTRQYAYDRSVTQIKRSKGRLERRSVAVVLNNTGRAAPWSTAELAQIEGILRNGLGLDTQRGDQLNVSALAFPSAPPVPPWWQQRDNVVEVGQGLGYLLAGVLAYFVVWRPGVRQLRQWMASPSRSTALAQITPLIPTQPEGSAHAAATMTHGQAEPTLALPPAAPPAAAALPPAAPRMSAAPLLENYDLPPPGSPVDVMVDHLKVLAAKEPERVAEVVKQWVQKHGRVEQAQ
ncbi:MAG: flagellar basal-body MS-ring/collar protein FliF [Aquabacterium sp.]